MGGLTKFDDAHTEVVGADLSDASKEVPFSIEIPEAYLADGEYYIIGLLAIGESACPSGSAPTGTVSSLNETAETNNCGVFTISGGADVTGVHVVLNYNI